STSPVRRSNSDPWHGQTITVPSSTPPDSGHSSCVQVSSNATHSPSTRPRHTARPPASTGRSAPSGAPWTGPTGCQVSAPTWLTLEPVVSGTGRLRRRRVPAGLRPLGLTQECEAQAPAGLRPGADAPVGLREQRLQAAVDPIGRHSGPLVDQVARHLRVKL